MILVYHKRASALPTGTVTDLEGTVVGHVSAHNYRARGTAGSVTVYPGGGVPATLIRDALKLLAQAGGAIAAMEAS